MFLLLFGNCPTIAVSLYAVKEKTPSCSLLSKDIKKQEMAFDTLFLLSHEVIAQKFGMTYKQLSGLIYPNTNKCE